MFSLKNFKIGKPSSKDTFSLPKEGIIFLVMMFAFFIGAMMGQSNLLLLIFSMMAGAFVVNGSVGYNMLRKIQITRKIPNHVMVGCPVSIAITLRNNKRLFPSFLMGIKDTIRNRTELINGNVLFLHVPQNDERTTQYQLCPMRRGKYLFGPAQIFTRFPLGFVERGLLVDSPQEMVVYPRLGTLQSSWKRILRSSTHLTQQTRFRSGNMDDEFHHIREYRSGDDPRTIHWKTTARRNELMVREFRESRDRDLILFLDLWAPAKPSAQESIVVENAVSLIATMGVDQLQGSGETSMNVIIAGRTLASWSNQDNFNSMASFLNIMALVEPGDAQEFWDYWKDTLDHPPPNCRFVMLTTRPAEQQTSGKFQQHLQKSWQVLDGFHFIEATPEKTAPFFQLH